MNFPYEPLPITIPAEYTDLLGCSPSHLSHVNMGRRRLRDDQCHLLLEAAESDPRLAGLTILDLRQELVQWQPHLRKLCPQDQKRQTKKKARRGQQ